MFSRSDRHDPDHRAVFQPLIKPSLRSIWFAIIVVIMVEVGLIHPPVGMNLFGHPGAGAPEVKSRPFTGVSCHSCWQPLVLIVLMFLFPQIACGCQGSCTAEDRSSSQAGQLHILPAAGPRI
jgi:TRAP-type mannitol/chloroaromatic compound transport system permease large subunit